MATAATTLEGRRAARDVVSFRATVEGPRDIRTTALMVDISPLGFMSRTNAMLLPDDIISVTLPVVGQRPARVVWSLGGRVGGEFLESIPAHLYGRLLANAPVHRPNWNEI